MWTNGGSTNIVRSVKNVIWVYARDNDRHAEHESHETNESNYESQDLRTKANEEEGSSRLEGREGVACKAIERVKQIKRGSKFPTIAPSIKLQIPETANHELSAFYSLPLPPPPDDSSRLFVFNSTRRTKRKLLVAMDWEEGYRLKRSFSSAWGGARGIGDDLWIIHLLGESSSLLSPFPRS